jgi:hypothetical protein
MTVPIPRNDASFSMLGELQNTRTGSDEISRAHFESFFTTRCARDTKTRAVIYDSHFSMKLIHFTCGIA